MKQGTDLWKRAADAGLVVLLRDHCEARTGLVVVDERACLCELEGTRDCPVYAAVVDAE